MELRTSTTSHFTPGRVANSCAQCGEAISLPEWSENLATHRVRHLWECEACGYRFETIVTFPET